MLTGDKKETAHKIGITCGLINNKTDAVFTVDVAGGKDKISGNMKEELGESLHKIHD